MFKRLELHNHTTESDSSMTPEELLDYMYSDQVDAFAITDHNTISGHQKIKDLLKHKNLPIDAIYGMEYTTYYGHILCLNLLEYVPWENINLHKPESLFQAAKAKNALVGVAHPFSYGNPLARGCRFDMTIHDFTSFDFIEVFNDPEPLHEVNERGLLWWEDLILQGYSLAATSGMDLHGRWDMSNQYATFIEGKPGGNITVELSDAILNQRTWVSRGPILNWTLDEQCQELTFTILDTKKPGYRHSEDDRYLLTLRTKKGTLCKNISQKVPLTISLSEVQNEKIMIPKLFANNTDIENLIVLAPVIDLGKTTIL